MFRFFIKRYVFKLSALRGLFIFSLIPALIYLIAAASQPDRFTMSQKITIAAEAPLALSGSPSDFAATDWFLVHQDELFLDAFTLQTLRRELQKELPPQSALPTEAQLIHRVKRTMSLSYQNAMLYVTYKGADQMMGKLLTAFYAGKVLKKAEDGIRRQEALQALQPEMEGQVTPVPGLQPTFGLSGGLSVESHSAAWRSERLPVTLLLFAAGLAAVLLWICILEALDGSFKSERQVARFLHIPVLGSVPNLSRIAKVMTMKI